MQLPVPGKPNCGIVVVRVLADKWAMPVMGWLSAADTLSQLTTFMSFSSKEEAIRVAERNGASVVCCRRAWQWCCWCQVECLLSPCCLVLAVCAISLSLIRV